MALFNMSNRMTNRVPLEPLVSPRRNERPLTTKRSFRSLESFLRVERKTGRQALWLLVVKAGWAAMASSQSRTWLTVFSGSPSSISLTLLFLLGLGVGKSSQKTIWARDGISHLHVPRGLKWKFLFGSVNEQQ